MVLLAFLARAARFNLAVVQDNIGVRRD